MTSEFVFFTRRIIWFLCLPRFWRREEFFFQTPLDNMVADKYTEFCARELYESGHIFRVVQAK